jgi:uncharacterized protein (DUF2132 family)
MNEHPNDPLHGVTLKAILEDLVARYGWEEMARCVPIRCFEHEPSLKSSLKFLRKTPWARSKLEGLYVDDLRRRQRRARQNKRRAAQRAGHDAALTGLEADGGAPLGGGEEPVAIEDEVADTSAHLDG